MADQGEQYERSWILHHILDNFIGSRDKVAVNRKLTLLNEQIDNGKIGKTKKFYIGSSAEGFNFSNSNLDVMFIDDDMIATYPFHDSSFPLESTDKTVCVIRDRDSRPSYVYLEMIKFGRRMNRQLLHSLVPVRDRLLVSSEIYSHRFTEAACSSLQLNMETHGPSSTVKLEQSKFPVDLGYVPSIPCNSWPEEASEWVSRPRPYGWPDKTLRDEIVQGGCHLVPVGDKTSPDAFLQWRLSFSTAERKLMHSLTHTQFLIYGLLKYFIKQISNILDQVLAGEDILSSYILKTVILFAVESTPGSLWQEKNTFLCFMLCLQSLIAFVKAGHCPNYFISNKNMFYYKVYGEKQQKLLHLLVCLYDMKWKCLLVGTAIQPSLGSRLQQCMRNGAWEWVLRPPTESGSLCDMMTLNGIFQTDIQSESLPMSLSLLCKSTSDTDEFLAYIATLRALCCTGMDTFEKHIPAKGNKEKYKILRKCKNLMTPLSSVCTSPGLLSLATYHYQTGNYKEALKMCGQMVSAFKIYTSCALKDNDKTRYEHLYCGRGYTLLQKCQEVWVSDVKFTPTALQLCPSQLHQELTNVHSEDKLSIPPLPYAVFLTFLCFHELGDTRRRDTALIHLRTLKYDVTQGVAEHWIVNNLLGICYEMVGDTRRALREYRDSLGVWRIDQYTNPAKERIERLRNSR